MKVLLLSIANPNSFEHQEAYYPSNFQEYSYDYNSYVNDYYSSLDYQHQYYENYQEAQIEPENEIEAFDSSSLLIPEVLAG